MRVGRGFVLVGMLAAWGCGALRNGSEQRVRVSTIPPGARVSIDGREITAPSWVTLRRDRDYRIHAELAGFQPAEAEIESREDRAVLVGNCLFFLCIPQLWEGGAPSQYRLEPDEVDLPLNPLGWSPR